MNDDIIANLLNHFGKLVGQISDYRKSLNDVLDAGDTDDLTLFVQSKFAIELKGVLRDSIVDRVNEQHNAAGDILVNLQEALMVAQSDFNDLLFKEGSVEDMVNKGFSEENINRFGTVALTDLAKLLDEIPLETHNRFTHALVTETCSLLALSGPNDSMSYNPKQGWIQIPPTNLNNYTHNNARVVTLSEAYIIVNRAPFEG